jgi:hypothetical protein
MPRENKLAEALRNASFALDSAVVLAGINALAEPAQEARKALEAYYKAKQEAEA